MPFAVNKVIENAHDDGIWAIKWSHGRLLTASVDDLVKSWTPNSDEPPTVLKGHELGVISVDVANSGSTAISSSLDSQIKIWDLNKSTSKTIECGPSLID